MSALLAWLVQLFTWMPSKVLVLLGFGWLTFSAYQAAVDSLVSSAISSVNSMPGVIYSLASLSGFVDGIGVLLSAIAVRSTFVFIDRLGRLT